METFSIQQFTTMMAGLWASYAKGAPEDSIVITYFTELSKYPMADVNRAFSHFISLGSPNGWPPALPQILNELPNAPQRVDMAFLRSQLIKPTTTVGALACAAVGSHDRSMMGDQTAERSITAKLTAFLNDLPELTREVTEGRGYTKHQIKVLKSGRYPDVNLNEFAGVPIQPAAMIANKQRAQLLLESGQLAIEDKSEPIDKRATIHPSVSEKLAALAADLDTAVVDEPVNELEPCTNCQTEFEAILTTCPRCGEKR